ncbi:family 20 glycosylhydrolase [Roseivirga sp. E12]|uniref:beta-N-acetylhexosaminidase n=1 Tax=Roseivirga sp. E12 TaxID=2819237 RepID=UPI001ABD443A|nr:family 20 glycosylhydrolase [Roseivirga sp. E12]MBO3697940.1 family 20 glycosylhydrolase [Roseivirga sp. E12]
MSKLTLLCIGIVLSVSTLANDLDKYLINPPQEISIQEGCLSDVYQQAGQLKNFVLSLKKTDLLGDISIAQPIPSKVNFSFTLDSINLPDQGYDLKIEGNQISVKGHSFAALYYAKQTILQLLEYAITESQPLPCLTIRDWPDFERRGYMLDVSRDKVPTMESLYLLVDQLSDWKINELQLYTEHTYAYKDHKVVWENSSPLTADEIQALDAYCRARYIDLVPNQNSFGHMENWLKHDEYLDLAECPEDCQTVWGKRKRTSFDPTNPKSLELMKSLYAEALPNFSSQFFNIGGDETVELCEGKSKAECDKIGKGQVYLNYLKKLNFEANRLGFKTQFWGDIILNHPELIGQLPKDMTALVWGYQDDHPFDEQLPKFKEAGLDFYVCPGTSSWRSLIGRNKNAFGNLKNAALTGKENGAKGYLNTNWGDYGHWQPVSTIYPSMMIGASYAWNYEDSSLKHLEFQLNQYVFMDKTGLTAKAVLQLGNAYLDTKIPKGNANAFHLLLRRYLWTMQGNYQTKNLTIENLESSRTTILSALDLLKGAEPTSADAKYISAELRQAAALAMYGIDLGIARLQTEDYQTKSIPLEKRNELGQALEVLIDTHKELWLMRNRQGGLADSSSKLEDILDFYKSDN